MDLPDFKSLTDHESPIYLQLYSRFRNAIATGKLAPGDRVPSIRSLASELNLARGTVEAAYQMLSSEGYLIGRGPAGTVVSPQLDGRVGAMTPVGSSVLPRSSQVKLAGSKPLQLGLPALDAFPRKTWVRLAGRNLRAINVADMVNADPNGYEPLRRAIAAYLAVSRGIACTPDQVFVTAGYRGALELIRRTLFRHGDSGWFEDPGYLHARRFLEDAGMQLVPLPVDDDGLNVEAGLRHAADARFAVVTPTHQSPSGVALSLPRRLALLDWAQAQRAWIIEDDYDSEFRYDGRPLPPLKSLDHGGRVLYAGTFSKVLYPGLRLAYLVVPEPEIGKFRNSVAQLGSSPVLFQATVADFMEQGHFARHIKKMRSLYAARRDYLVQALAQVFGDVLLVPERAGGIHVVAYLKPKYNDKAFAAAANAKGLAVMALSEWHIRHRSPVGLLMGFANIATSEQALKQVRRLRDAVDH
ncbi:PLP-dependent aminotransferase family protein [Paraburkholderia sp. LEh10]|jgi:GntR family transcriptional regulator/MocR family aminotransferase|uniref:MocR-like pyridoxine biosynthesis transcription factor PdxR n=1 Tax=Paraburkholderia sp. LEh10 TaxID=2821353 RepID=UPI001AEB5559|nr:PLP-dependent aminotransferase family protein [Paraburkholderia sp. LEh10]MBP0594162.1 PLP-dependent aminotransferase family protein [Paraburkholderia sp. LEh10]